MGGRVDYVYNEVYLLEQCEHEHICRLLEAYESPSYFFLVFEFAPFGDLFEFIKQTGIPVRGFALDENFFLFLGRSQLRLHYVSGGVYTKDVFNQNVFGKNAFVGLAFVDKIF